MKVVIIEDEPLTAEDLADILLKMPDGIEVVKILDSVKASIEYLKQNHQPDLIFSDIQLGDGHSFEIFQQLKLDVPIIFCTAYDAYALDAFKTNGIDYVLKPFTKKTIRHALDKYNLLRNKLAGMAIDFDNLLDNLQKSHNPQKKMSSLLINWKDKIIPIKITDIALITIDYKMSQVVTFNNQKYFVNHTLEELEDICGPSFYRANRQFLINREVVAEAMQYYARKLVLKLKVEGKYEIIISKTRVPEFLSWLRS
jgi:two-component system, LytTR family, response regulator LytT